MVREQNLKALQNAWLASQTGKTDILAESRRLRALVAHTGKQIHLLENQLQAAGRVAMFGHFEIDGMNCVKLSASARALLDVPLPQIASLKIAFERAPEAQQAQLMAAYDQLRAEGTQVDQEIGFHLPGGAPRWLRVVIRRPHDAGSTTFGLLVDITAAKLDVLRRDLMLQVSNAMLQETDSEEAYRAVLQCAGMGLGWDVGACWLLMPGGRKVRCLAAWVAEPAHLQPLAQAMQGRIIGADAGMVGAVLRSGQEMWSDNAGVDTRFAEHELLATLGVKSAYTRPILTDDGKCAGVLQFLSRHVREEDPQVREIGSLIGSLLVQRARREAWVERLRDAAERDALTGLYSRFALSERIRKLIDDDAAVRFTVCVLDLNRFKRVNQAMGQAAGDLVLVTTANRLSALLGAGVFAARLGSDEFAVLLTEQDGVGADQTVEEITGALSDPFQVNGYDFDLSVSVGVSHFPGDGTDADGLIREADQRRLRAKRPAVLRGMRSVLAPLVQIQTEKEFRSALEGSDITVHYQPIINLVSRAVVGAEALVRWNHPQKGLLMPGAFLDIAEDAGLMRTLSERVIDAVVRDAASAAGWLGPMWRFNINLTALDFRDFKMFKSLGRTLAGAGVAPERLRFEITESTLMEDMDNAERVIGLLAGYGVEFAIDDFGTGFSSLAQLSRLPVHEIKIDSSFTRSMDSVRGATVVRAILDLAARLGMPVTAEGVETAEQMTALTEYGCAKAQGYLYAPAMPFGALASWLSDFAAAHSGNGTVS